MTRKTRFNLLALGSVLLVAVVIWATAGIVRRAFGPPAVVTDPGMYPELLKEWSAKGLVAHFPATIPSNATNVHFSAFSGWGQGPGWLQLRMQLPLDEVNAIEQSLKQKTTHVYVGGNSYTSLSKDPKNNWPTTEFRTADGIHGLDYVDFPDSYTLYVLHAVDYGHGSWDPHDSSGAAVSKTKGEIVYWADQ